MNTSKNANVTKTQVADAVSILSTRGDPVTTKSVRAHIGHGSYTTINKYLSDIRALEWSKLDPEKMLTALPDKLRSITSEIYCGARSSLMAEMNVERQKIKSLEHDLRHRWRGLVRDKFKAARELDTERKLWIALQEQLLDKIEGLQDRNSHLEKYIAELSDEHLMKTAKIEQELKNSQARVLQLSLKLAGV
jgi:hypothetical protein